MRYLITGHPRSGTAYVAKYMQSKGLHVCHEEHGANGISSWMAITGCPHVPWGEPAIGKYDQKIYIMREPMACIASVAHTETQSLIWRAEFVCIRLKNPLAQAIDSIYGWYERYAKECDRVVALEALPEIGERTNSRSHDPFTMDDIAKQDNQTKVKYNELVRIYDKLPKQDDIG